MKYLPLLLCTFLVACGGHDKAGSGETTRTISSNNWPSGLTATEDEAFHYDPKIESSLAGGVTYIGQNIPDWASIDSRTGILTGTPTNDDSGQKYTGLKIIAQNSGTTALEVGPFELDVIAVNDAPEIEPQSLIANKVDGIYQGVLAYSDIDNTDAELNFEFMDVSEDIEVSRSGSGGKIKVTPLRYRAFTDAQSFKVRINDGTDVSQTVAVTTNFVDETEFLVTSNLPNSSNIVAPERITFSSSQPLPAEMLLHNTQIGPCVGYFQLSTDGFNTCLPIDLEFGNAVQDLVWLTSSFMPVNLYQFRLKASLTSVYNKQLSSESESTFNTLDSLIITEVSGGDYRDRRRWLELYNASSEKLNLENYALRSMSVKNSDNSISIEPKQFELPQFELSPGQYVLLKTQDFKSLLSSTNHVIYLGDNVENPFWASMGVVEIVKRNGSAYETVDYVAWADPSLANHFKPISNSAWNDELLPSRELASDEAELSSLSRGAIMPDSNTKADWSESVSITPGYSNDILCNIDSDSDGFPDCTEEPGSTFAGVDLYSLGARNGQRDVFVEVDYMESTTAEPLSLDSNIRPRRKALEMVKAVFAENGIAIHFDAASLFPNTEFDLGGGSPVPFSKCLSLDYASNCSDLYEIKNAHMDLRRLYSFHYILFGYQEPILNVKGRAELPGNDVTITMGGWKNDDGSVFSENQIINHQAGLIMHELGHNFGLRHGGHEELNYKPNYVSVMNYLYDTEGLPTIGEREGQRYYNRWFINPNDCFGINGKSLTNPTTGDPDDFVIDYSHGEAVSILERAINESAGLGHIGSGPVDFDCSGTINSELYTRSLTDESHIVRFDELRDHDDWAALDLAFQITYRGNTSRIGKRNPQDAPIIFIGDDRGEISKEY